MVSYRVLQDSAARLCACCVDRARCVIAFDADKTADVGDQDHFAIRIWTGEPNSQVLVSPAVGRVSAA